MILFSSVLIFPHRPVLFIDILSILVSIPLIIIVTQLIRPQLRKYMYIYGILLLIHFLTFIVPPGHGLFFVSMLLIAVIEFFALYNLYLYGRRNRLKRKRLHNLLVFTIFIHILFAVTGFLSLLFGATVLTEISLNIGMKPRKKTPTMG